VRVSESPSDSNHASLELHPDPDERSRRRMKRSSRRPAKGPSITSTKERKRKVGIDDFGMMRVLGKGCSGFVMLVRHKQTRNLFALKVSTKKHLLAHQKLQHVLTEQAVLKKMAVESRDPFVVKLWWSFHDEADMFLVMVCFVFPVQRG